MKILQEEASLDEIVRLVGMDALSPADRLTMETAKSIREDYLHQNAFHEVDTYASLIKQFKMLKLIIENDKLCRNALSKGVELEDLMLLPIKEKIGRSKYIEEKDLASFDELFKEMKQEIVGLEGEGEN